MRSIKDFSIIELSSNIIVIVLNNSLRVDNFVQQIKDTLNSKSFHGIVYFDLLLSNGLNSKRFFMSQYLGEQLDITTITRSTDIPEEVISKSNEYFFSHKDLLDRGILTASAKQRFLYDC